MKFPTTEKLQAAINGILQTLGFIDKAKKNEMSAQDWATFSTAFEKEHGIALKAALAQTKNANENSELTQDQKQDIIGAITTACDNAGVEQPKLDLSNVGTALSGIMGVMDAMAKNMQLMGKRQEQGAPLAVVTAAQDPSVMARVLGIAPHSQTHLYGIESNHYMRGNWWNELVATGQGLNMYKDKDIRAFERSFNEFVDDFSERCAQLIEGNQLALLDYNKMIRGESMIDYSNMNAKFGEYTVRRFDTIIAYFRELKSVASIFPIVSNVQNETTAPTAYFGELSQSYLSGHNYKGDIYFDGEKYRVDDLMMKFAFKDGKDLEKQYIGYKNREGSNPMKWHLFEWIIIHFGKILFNEQQRRRVVGTWTPRQGNVPQPAMTSADGALRAIQRVEEELKVLPFKDMKGYTKATILEYVRTFYEKVSEILPSMEGMRLFMNEKHRLWYMDAYDAKYKTNNDYSGPRSDIRYYSPKDIIWIPNMELNDYKMWITTEGNIENYEDKPNEMFAFYFQQDLEILVMASWWKEGSGVLAPGVQYPSPEELEKAERRLQFLFTNYPVGEIAANADTIDMKAAREFETSANTAATNITTVKNIVPDKVIKVICGSLDNKTTINKTGIFSKINSNWEPAKVGDWISIYPELEEKTKQVGKKQIKVVVPTGNFLELERKAY